MVSLVAAVGLLFMVCLHTVFAAVATRFFRIRLDTRWGAHVYILFVIPVVLVLSTMILSGPLGLGANVGSRESVFLLVVAIPLALGYVIDVFWMPHPDDVEIVE